MATTQLASTSVGIKNVLIATDFSHHSDAALHYGLEFAHLYGAQAEIAYVVPTDEFVLAGPEGLHAAREAARRDLLDFKARLRHLGPLVENLDYNLTMLEGPVADCLLQCAREKKIDLLVVGTHGRRGLGKFLLGSVAEKVFRHSPVPVLTVGPNIHEPREINLSRHIVAPCDLTPKSHPAVQYACALAEAHHSRLTVLHVVERLREVTNLDPYRVKQEIREKLADIAGRIPEGVDVDYRVEFGNVASTILRVASETAANLIVVGVRRSAGVLDRFMWPIAYELVREAACPVLTLRGSLPMDRVN
jgi:nucleotide-binding universal stress UspA family protein